MDDPASPSLFVSYAHEDRDIVAELRKCFIPLERRFGCQLLWDDSLIRGGEQWLDRIEQAMTHARFAVLLMSADFMVSNFIQKQELPRLLDRSRSGELTVLPMLVGPIDLEASGVEQLQFVNPPEQPLGLMSRFEQQQWYLKVAMYVKEVLLQGPHAANDGRIGPAAQALASSSVSGAELQAKASSPPAAPVPTDAEGRPAHGLAAEAAAAAIESAPLDPDTAQWTALIPPRMAVAEIENQLTRLKRHTRSLGFAVFDCDGYYVQVEYRAGLDDRSVIVEAQSNAYLQNGRRLGALQMRHLTQRLRFSQPDPGENLLRYAPMRTDRDMVALARQCWELLTDVYPSVEGSPLTIQSQCR